MARRELIADADFERALAHAGERYRPAGRVAYHFARGKLRGDPVYRAVLEGGLLPQEGTLLDLGCGGGLMLALLASARVLTANAATTGLRLVGIETRPRAAAVARGALGADAEIRTADVRREALPRARAILLFDVLNLMPAQDQDALLREMIAILEPGGVLLVREADAAAGWRFQAVRLGNWITAWWKRGSSRDFHFRAVAEWCRWLTAADLEVSVRPMGMGTPFGNVLLVARRKTSITS